MMGIGKFVVVLVTVFLVSGVAKISFSATLEEQMELTGIGPVKTNYKDPGHAAKLAFNFSPIAYGQFYVGEWKKGIWFTVGEIVMATGVVMPAYQAYTLNKKDPPEKLSNGNIVLGVASFLGYAVLKVWAAYDGGWGAERFNVNHKTAGLFLRLAPKSAQLCFKRKF